MIAIALTDILRAERARRNSLYPRLVSEGKMTSAQANQYWARFCTLLPRGGVGTDLNPKYFVSTDQAVEEYDRWIREEMTNPASAPAVAILMAWLAGFRPSIATPPPPAPTPHAKQGTLL